MTITAIGQSNWERTLAIRRVKLVQAVASRAVLLRRGLNVLRDWRIYADFSAPAYQQHNLARLQHLDSLGLDLSKKNVLEIGAAIGDHTLFYLFRNCNVVAVEGRPRLARRLSERLGVEVAVIDLENEPERLGELGRFDLVHCYGLLYHLSDPARLLAAAARSAECLLLETCVSGAHGHGTNTCDEDRGILSQAIHGKGCRPTREWIFEQLKSLYQFVYVTRTQPHHSEFPTRWDEPDAAERSLKRAVFIASQNPIDNPNLTTELPDTQPRW